jgi:hypothetical protein
LGLAGIELLQVALLAGDQPSAITPTNNEVFVILARLLTAVALVLWFRSIAPADVVVVAPFFLLVPITASVLDALISILCRPLCKSWTAEGRSCRAQFRHQLGAHHAEESLEVISKHMQAHFRAGPVKGLRKEVRGTHPCLDCAERMLHRLPSQMHLLRRFTEPFRHRINESFMFPSSDATFRTVVH